MSAQAVRTTMTMAVRRRVTQAQVNAGFTLVAATPKMAYRIVDLTMIAIGGAASGATSVDIIATSGAATVRPFVVAVAALTQSAVVKPNSANVTVLADGASYVALDANTAIAVGKQSGGSNLATATNIDVILTYTAEKA